MSNQISEDVKNIVLQRVKTESLASIAASLDLSYWSLYFQVRKMPEYLALKPVLHKKNTGKKKSKEQKKLVDVETMKKVIVSSYNTADEIAFLRAENAALKEVLRDLSKTNLNLTQQKMAAKK